MAIPLPLLANRHTPLSALAIAVLACSHIDDVWNRLPSTRPRSAAPGGSRPLPAWADGACPVGAAVLLAITVPRLACIRIDPPVAGPRPALAVALLKTSGVAANMAVDFDWGSYVLERLGPAIKVSVDGRRETLYEGEVYLQSLRFRNGIGEWDALLTRYGTDLVLVSKRTAAFNLMKLRPGWSLLYEDPVAALFGKPESPVAAAVRATAPPPVPYDGAGLCFP